MAGTHEQRIQTLEKLLSSQPRSPLFAQLASYYLEAGRTQDALNLCDSGLAHYPFYTTGHLIKGKTLLALNMRSEARREFEFVHQMLPQNETVNRLLADIPPSSEESLSEPAPPQPEQASPETVPAEPLPEQPSETTEGTQSADAGTDQWMAQFTDDTAPSGRDTTDAPPPAAESQEPSQVFEPPAEQIPEGESSGDPFGLAQSDQDTQESSEAVSAESAHSAPEEEGEPFEQFAERKRGELFGLENSMSLDDYLADGNQTEVPTEPQSGEPASGDPFASQEPQQTPDEGSQEDPFAALTQYSEPEPPPVGQEPPAVEQSDEDPFAQLRQGSESGPQEPPGEEPKDQIEELAEKLKDAKKITPVINLSDRTSIPPSESETPAGTGFVTPTLAEIYAKQGWYDDAIKAYKTLAANKPSEREKYGARISELEELKKRQENG